MVVESWMSIFLDYIWLIKLSAFLLLILAVHLFLRRIAWHFKRHARFREYDWRSRIDYIFLTPLHVLLWILFFAFAISLSAPHLGMDQTSWNFSSMRNAAIVACLAWFFLRWKKIFQQSLLMRQVRGKIDVDSHSIQIMGKVSSFIVIFISLLIVLQIFGLNVMPLIAFGGIGAAAAGFASKEVIANFFGGLMIHLTRPFVVKDLIELPGKKILGYIEEIGWYYTSVRDLKKQPIFIPNSMFATEVMVNQSRITHRRFEESIGIRYEDAAKVDFLVKKIRELLAAHPVIDHSQPLLASMVSFGSTSLEIEIKAYTLSTDLEEFLQIRQEILLKIYEIVIHAGADFSSGILNTKFFENLPKKDS